MNDNEDWACPLCGRDDFRCKCDYPMPTKTSVGEDDLRDAMPGIGCQGWPEYKEWLRANLREEKP